jgi:hypothetical protein
MAEQDCWKVYKINSRLMHADISMEIKHGGNMTRQEFINVLLPAIIRSGADRATADRIIEMKTTSELRILHARFIREGRIQLPTPTVTQADVDQAAQDAELELETIREQHRERLSAQRAERDADRILFQRQQYLDREPQRKAQAEQALAHDKTAFNDAAKVLRSFSPNSEANFNLCRQVLGEGNVSAHLISEDVASGALQLSKITQAELDEYRAEDVQAANRRLLDMNPLELKAEIRRETQADSYAGYPDMPMVNSDGTKLDSRFFRRATAAEIRTYVRRYGNVQVTDAIRNRV